MAETKTRPTAANPDDFIAAVPDPKRRADCAAVVQMMREETGEPPVMWGENIIGFGAYEYRYASGRTGDWPVTGVSPRKESLSLYFPYCLDQQAELLTKLGKHKIGKGCLYIKRLSDVEVPVLETLIAECIADIRRRGGR